MSKFKISFGDGGDHKPTIEEKRKVPKDERSLLAALQKNILETDLPPEVEGLEKHFFHTSSTEVDADLVTFIVHSPHCIDLLIGDLSLKGTEAAILASQIKEIVPRENLYTVTKDLPSPSMVVTYLEDKLFDKLVEHQAYLTLIYARFDLENMELQFVDRGFTQTLIVQKNGDLYFLTSEDLPLGVQKKSPCTQDKVPLNVNDKVLFYSDGVIDLRNDKGEMFGFLSLAKIIDQCKNHDPKTILEMLQDKLMEYKGEGSLHDDIFLFLFKVLPITSTPKTPQKKIISFEEPKEVILETPPVEKESKVLETQPPQEEPPPPPKEKPPAKESPPPFIPPIEPSPMVQENLAIETQPLVYDPRTFKELQRIQLFVEDLLKNESRFKWKPQEIFQLKLVVHEMCISILQIAEVEEGDDEILEVLHEEVEKGIRLTFYYRGTPFDPAILQQPEIMKKNDQGLNLYIIQKNVNDVRYGKDSKGRSYVEVVKITKI